MIFPMKLASRWPNAMAMRMSARLDRPALARGIEALLRPHGGAIAYEVFGRGFLLCAPEVPGVEGDAGIALVLDDAEHGLFLVAQRERGGLSFVSVHEAIHDATADLFSRAAPRLLDAREQLARLIGACTS